MEVLHKVFDTLLHLNTDSLNALAGSLGIWFYVLLFAIVFCETGLVVTPFLPGDSLLFAVGAVAASGSAVSLPLLLVVLIVAAIAGDAVNYYLGYRLGPRVFQSERSRFLNKKHLVRAHEFYEKYGPKTIVLARFIPIIRTFAPFVAGIGKMDYRKFSLYNISGGIAWVVLFLVGGYQFGTLEWVQSGFHYVIAGIIVISILPAVVELVLARFRKHEPAPSAVPAATSSEPEELVA